jgi:hypothetical protein
MDLVLEDITPRLMDLDGDGANETIPVRTAVLSGAAVATYGIKENALVEKAATATIGTRHRWPLIELLEFKNGQLKSIRPKISGFTPHIVGSRHLTLATAGDLEGDESDELIIPSQDRLSITALNFSDGVK